MTVKELISYLEKCNPEAQVYSGEVLYDSAEEINNIVEVGCSNMITPTVYLFGR